MARKNKNIPQTTGVDKIENFLQNYFKQLIMTLAVIVVLFIVSYAVYSINQSSKAKKADLVGEAQVAMTTLTPESLKSFEELSLAAPFLKNYIDLVSGEAWAVLGDNASALKILAPVSGDYKEMAAGLSFDLGEHNINIDEYLKSGKMKPIWYYRQVLASTGEERAKNLALFKSLYPDNKLIALLENWD